MGNRHAFGLLRMTIVTLAAGLIFGSGGMAGSGASHAFGSPRLIHIRPPVFPAAG